MRIVVLDGYTLNPGDLSWEPIRALGECVVYDRTPREEVAARAAGAQVVLTNKAPVDRTTIEALPDLRLIAVTATGHNVVDTAAAKGRGVLVCNVPEYGTPNVAQHVFALLLELTTRAGHHAQTVRDGRWAASADWCYWDSPLVELNGLTMGVVGYGRIGRAVGQIARAFGMNVIAYRRNVATTYEPDVRWAELDELFRQSDVVSLHCPLTPDNARMVDAARLATMRPTAFLINTARGGLVDEPDLAAALNAGTIAGAGLDVLTAEPPRAGSPLIGAKNCVITPHFAWASRPARQRLLAVTAENIRRFGEGKPQNVVNA